ncbi:MAG: metalloregulator ArsR/SmtB family transcription factor [Bacteroidota bacterium]|nr:metalloregulator ArsR/SmtB family transcription factor [Bacteroidota bacterium]
MTKPIPVCKIGIVHKDKVKSAQSAIKNEHNILEASEIFKILSDPTRLKIVMALAKEELCVCDIAALLNLTESAISHQLRLLKNSRIVKHRRDGKMAYYTLDDEHIEDLIKAALQHTTE